jgi:hypothetical protein
MRNRLIAVAALFACAVTAVAQEAQPAGAQSNYLIAKQGKAEVWAIDVDAHLASMPEKERAGFIDSPKRIQQLLGHLLLRRNLAIEAKELGLDKDPVVQRELLQAAEVVLMRIASMPLREEHAGAGCGAAREGEVPEQSRSLQDQGEGIRRPHPSRHEEAQRSAEADRPADWQWKAEVEAGKAKMEELAKVATPTTPV